MLSVTVHKDVAEYKPKIIGKLTGRTLGSIAGALGCSVLTGIYIHFVLGLNVDDFIFIVYAVSLPFWLIGFLRPKGMPFEKYLPLWIQHNMTGNRILYTSTIYRIGLASCANNKEKSSDKLYRKLASTKGIEAWEPSREYSDSDE